jgi:hypothetical protein
MQGVGRSHHPYFGNGERVCQATSEEGKAKGSSAEGE